MLDFTNLDNYQTRVRILNKLKAENKPVFIFGAGRFGVAAAEMCIDEGIHVEGFVESDEYWRIGKFCIVKGREIKCYSSKEVKSVFNDVNGEYNILCGIINYGQLAELREVFTTCSVVAYLDAYPAHIMTLDFLKNNKDIITEIYHTLKDIESKSVLEAYLHARYTGDVEYLSKLNHSVEFSYDWELLNVSENDVLVDGGAYIGDSIHELKQICKLPRDIYAFEPDTNNMLELIRGFSPEDMKNVHPILSGLFSSDTELHFENSGTLGSAINENGEFVVEVQSLDTHDAYKNVSVIKMDIEGSELQALKGAYNLLKNKKPRLAICIYHNNEDIIEIYNYLKQFGYEFYLRQHSMSCEETVLYAI